VWVTLPVEESLSMLRVPLPVPPRSLGSVVRGAASAGRWLGLVLLLAAAGGGPAPAGAAAAAQGPASAATLAASPPERRPMVPADLLGLRAVGNPEISPEGAWVAYTVASLDAERDRGDVDVWMLPLAGGEALRLTGSTKPESDPRFSPDGRFLAFLSAREGESSQVWLLDRRGGEARQLTKLEGDVSDLAWSPDSRRLAVIVHDPEPKPAAAASMTAAAGPGGGEPPAAAAEGSEKPKTPPPIVVTRLQFKRDGEGYLDDRRDHLWVVDVATGAAEQITRGPYDHSEPQWSPDGRWVAFVANRTADPDRNQNTDLFVVAPRAGAEPLAVTRAATSDSSPAWSPDGRWLAFVHGGAVEDLWYGSTFVAVAEVGALAGEPAADTVFAVRALTRELDRNVLVPTFSPDGEQVLFLVEDGGNQHLARVAVGGGSVERVVAGEREITDFAVGPGGELVVLESQWDHPEELSLVAADGSLVRLGTTNDAWLSKLALAPTERFRATAADGTPVDAFLTLPPGATRDRRYPTLLRIHGGPTSQYATGWELDWQLLAAHGYAVVAANPRGSTGYGTAFSRALWARWGEPDFDDVMAAVDEAIRMGVADPDRLGVGGWSYGGILTNYVITKTDRFKAAISGASEANYLANYGVDHYQYEWEVELGLPWENTELWLRLSPFFQVGKVRTPTLWMCGQEDWNVPLINSEQMYQALRRLGVPTELVVYPGQTHRIRVPSYQVDRYERYLAWYDRYVLGKDAAKEAAAPR
jgi:dipeptidyl aminopeptidase/acylaminoacyl peptidase